MQDAKNKGAGFRLPDLYFGLELKHQSKGELDEPAFT
jgi:hypothetical protein